MSKVEIKPTWIDQHDPQWFTHLMTAFFALHSEWRLEMEQARQMQGASGQLLCPASGKAMAEWARDHEFISPLAAQNILTTARKLDNGFHNRAQQRKPQE